MRPTLIATTVALSLVALSACGGGGTEVVGEATTSSAAPPEASSMSLPAPCELPPYTAALVRDGTKPVGSAQYGVVGAVALPVPLVPDRADTISDADAIAQAASTDLLMYSVVVGDEPIEAADVSLLSGYAPTVGQSRAFVSIAPSSPMKPLAVGDVVTPGPATGLGMFTSLQSVTMDITGALDEFTAYLAQPAGDVTVLGLTEEAICLDVDLTWDYADGAATPLGTLTIKGIFAAALAPREGLPLT